MDKLKIVKQLLQVTEKQMVVITTLLTLKAANREYIGDCPCLLCLFVVVALKRSVINTEACPLHSGYLVCCYHRVAVICWGSCMVTPGKQHSYSVGTTQ